MKRWLSLPKFLLEALWFAPFVCMIAGLYYDIQALPLLLGWLTAAAFLGGLASMLPGRMRLAGALVASGIWLAAWLAARIAGGAGDSGTMLTLMSAVCVSSAFIAARQVHLPMGESFRTTRWAMGAIFYVTSWIALFFAMDTEIRAVEGWLALAYGLCMILCLNHDVMSTESLSKERDAVPPSYRTGNRWMAALLCVLVVILVNAGWLMRMAGHAFAFIGSMIMAAVEFITNVLSPSSSGNGTMGDSSPTDLPLDTITQEPGLISRILEIAIYVVTIAVLLVLFALAARILYRLFKRFWARVMQALATYRQGMNDVYVDEVTRLDTEDLSMRGAGQRLMTRLREMTAPRVRWESLSNRDRVRRAFALLLTGARKSGKQVDTRTPAEMLAQGQLTARGGSLEGLVDAYEEARYSEHDIGDQQAETAMKTAGVKRP